MIITGFLMVSMPILISKSIDVILVVFGVIGIVFSLKDLILYKKPGTIEKSMVKITFR